MCWCEWMDCVKSGRALYRILCCISVALQIIFAVLIVYIVIVKDDTGVSLGISTTFATLLLFLSFCLIYVLCKENLFYLKMYIASFVFVSLCAIFYLLLLMVHLVKSIYTVNWEFDVILALFLGMSMTWAELSYLKKSFLNSLLYI
ncbi:uncharacterized protein LOC111595486 [Drosophila hydei]|uniref:Uncharacterized protein LOC111595486 n=1 Tax=Drosophila hydei TaxID=7224 RepID=A0A6J1LH90_DROHY|nr:uncharacterized protein LOC111595486 [Drosophila hydei]